MSVEMICALIDNRNFSSIAANQLHFPLAVTSDRIIAVRQDESFDTIHVMSDPEIIYESDEKSLEFESCSSCENKGALVERSKFIRVLYNSIMYHDNIPYLSVHTKDFGDDMARRVLHTIDHLNGKMFFDYSGRGPMHTVYDI